MQPALFFLCSGLLCLVRAQDWQGALDDLKQDIEQRLSFLEDLNKPRITTKPRVVTEGVYVDLTCDVVGQPTPSVTWYKGDQVFNLQSNPRASMPGTSLAFTNVNRADQGDYKCVATNHFGSVTSDITTLTVNYKPEITNQPSSQTVAEGAINVNLMCGVTGQPEPSVTWYKGDVALDGTMLSGTSLEFTNVQRADQGDYKCVATNCVGAVTSLAATLTVDRVKIKVPDEHPRPKDFDLQFDGLPQGNLSETKVLIKVVNNNSNSSHTVCLWVKASDDIRGSTFSMPNGFSMLRNPASSENSIKFGNSIRKIHAYNDGNWHHFCLTCRRLPNNEYFTVATSFYQDGNHVGSFATKQNIHPTGDLYIGNDRWRRPFAGYISGLNIWSRVLDKDEISRMSAAYTEDEGDIFKWRDARQGEFHGKVRMVTPSTCCM